HLVEIDVLDAQAPQRILQSGAQVTSRDAQVVGARPHGGAGLGGEHDVLRLLGVGGQPATDDLLGDPGAVDVGGVEEVAADLDVGAHDLVGGRLVGLFAEGHRAQGQRRDDGAAAAQKSVVHGLS